MDSSSVGGILIAVILAVVAYVWGGMKATTRKENDQLKRNADAHVKARKAQDEMASRDGDSVDQWLRRRSGK